MPNVDVPHGAVSSDCNTGSTVISAAGVLAELSFLMSTLPIKLDDV